MLLATAAATLAQIVPLGVHRERGAAGHGLEGAVDGSADGSAVAVAADGGAAVPAASVRPGLVEMLPLLAFTGLYVCVYAGESIKYAYLPLYMADDLQLPAGVSGAVIGLQPLVELVLMPFVIVLGRRIGMLRLMILGAAAGVGANLLFALSGSALGLFAGQVLMGGVWGVFAVLGIIVAQRLLPRAVATASAVFLSSTAISSALGGALGGIGAGVIGLPLVFLLPAALGVVAMAGLALMDRRLRDRVERTA